MGEITDGYYSDRNWRFGDELCAGENLRASVGKEPGCRVEFQKEPSLEGRDAMLTETIYNRKWLFLPVLQVGFQMHRNLWFADGENTSVSDQCYKRDIFSVGGYQKITRTIPFHCSKRGYYELSQVELVTRSPLMNKKFYKTLESPDHFYVYPRMVDDTKLEIPFQKIMGSVLSQKNLYEDPFEFRGIREYQLQIPCIRSTGRYQPEQISGWSICTIPHRLRK